MICVTARDVRMNVRSSGGDTVTAEVVKAPPVTGRTGAIFDGPVVTDHANGTYSVELIGMASGTQRMHAVTLAHSFARMHARSFLARMHARSFLARMHARTLAGRHTHTHACMHARMHVHAHRDAWQGSSKLRSASRAGRLLAHLTR